MEISKPIGMTAMLTGLAWGASGLLAGFLADALRSLAPGADPASIDPIPHIVLGAAGGLATGAALRRHNPHFRIPQVIACGVVWALGLGASAWASTGLWVLAMLAYPLLSGLIGGSGTAVLLRMSLPGLGIRHMLTLVAGWTLACLVSLIPLLVPAIERTLQSTSTGLAFIWAIAGGLGSFFTLRSAQRAALGGHGRGGVRRRDG